MQLRLRVQHSITLLRKSLSLAKSLHAAVIRQGCAILDKNSIKTLRAFRFVAIREGRDLPLFSQASTLARLAQWLVEATRDKVTRQASSKNKEAAHPVVVACLNEEKGTYMVVGVTGAPEFGDIRKK
jgi:cell division control protein 45